MRLFGVLPFDHDDLMITELWPGRGFHEESTMLRCGGGATSAPSSRTMTRKPLSRDRLTFELRAPLGLLTPIVAAGVGALFGHRDRRLQRTSPRR